MIRSGKLRILSTFILALALVAQPFSALSASVSATATPAWGNWTAWTEDGTVTPVVGGALDSDGSYAFVNKSVYTNWGRYEHIFPTGGYSTSIDVYLDMEMAQNNPGKHFDFSSAINNASGNHLRDFAFNVGAGVAGTDDEGKWFVATSNGADANTTIDSSTFESVEITESGWYTLRADFNDYDDVLAVELSVSAQGSSNPIESWLLKDPSDQISTVVGGHRYGWFVNQPFESLPIDNATLTTNNQQLISNSRTGEKFNSIQQAIDDVHTLANDTIQLVAGEYTESVMITKAITLAGPNAGIDPVTAEERVDEAYLTGQITVFSSGATVDGLTIMNPDYSGATIKGVHVYGGGDGISGISVMNNIITDIANGNPTKGSYGVMVQGAVSDVTISNNLITDISSEGWAHGIEVTPSNGVATNPADITVTGNSISGVTNGENAVPYDFSVDTSDTDVANASQVTFKGNRITGAVQNLDTDHVLDASANWWGSETSVSGPSSERYAGSVTVKPWCAWEDCGSLATDQPLALPVTSGMAQIVTDTVLDSTSSADNVRVVIAAGTTVTSDVNWNGVISAPTVTSFTVPNASGTSLAISVGSSDYSISFDRAVALVMPGQAGKSVGFKAPGGNFTEITTVCDQSMPSQNAADTQLVGSIKECKMNFGSDLIIWTKHFTTFATFTPQVVTPAATTSTKSKARSTSFFGVTTYDDTWMDGAAGLQSAGKVKSDNAGVSSTSTVATATADAADAKGTTTWYWWLLGAALLAAAWPAYNALRARYFNR